MHPVEAANERGLAAAGRTDYGRHCIGSHFYVDFLENLRLSEPGVQILYFNSNTHRMKAPCKLSVALHASATGHDAHGGNCNNDQDNQY